MTNVVVDSRLSQDMKDAIASALNDISTNPGVYGVLAAQGVGDLVVTDRLPVSASVLDPTTGERILVTDPVAIAAMLPGQYAFVGASSNGPDGTRAIVFDWGEAAADGVPVLFLGSGIVDSPTHSYQVSGAYGFMTDMPLERVLVNGLSRAFADAAGTFENTTLEGVDHGVGFAQIVDGLGYTRAAYDPDHSYFDIVGPGSYAGGVFGNTPFAPLGMSAAGMTATFSVSADGSIVIENSSDGSEAGVFTARTTLKAPGHEVLGISYENYAVNEFFGTAVFGTVDDLYVGFEGTLAGLPDFMSVAMNAAGKGIFHLDFSINEIVSSGLDDGSTVAIADALGLHGFTYHSIGQQRVLSAMNIREVNQTSKDVAYGVQVENGEILYDTTGIAGVGTSEDPTLIAVDDRGSTVDTIIVGTGRLENVHAGATQFGNNTSETHDNRMASNLIQAGEGDDIIVTVRPETWPVGLKDEIHGNGGDDLIMLNTTDAIAYGGTGNDTIAIGMGDQIAYGGDGYDTISFSGNLYADRGLVFDARTGLGDFSSDGFHHVVEGYGFERIVGTNEGDVIVGTDGMTIDGWLGNDDITLGNMGIAIGGRDDDAFRLEVAKEGTARYLLLGVDAGDSLYLDGVRHYGSQAVVTTTGGIDGAGFESVAVDWRSGLGDSVWNTDRDANTDPNAEYWTEQLFHGTDQTHQGETLSKIVIQRHVGGVVVATTEIYMTGFTNGDAGLSYDQVRTTDNGDGTFDYLRSTAGAAGYDLHMTENAMDVVSVFQPSQAPIVADMFGLV